MQVVEEESFKKSSFKNLKKKAINRKFSLPKGNWTKQLKVLPSNFDEACISKLHHDALAKKHLILGYRMFKASKVTEVFLSPGSQKEADSNVFIKSKVEASIATKYDVAIKLKSATGQVDLAWCARKAGCGGVCKHVGSVLWYILDCVRLGKTFVPDDLLCTEKARSWNVLTENKKLSKRSFAELEFVKHTPAKSSEVLKERQRNQQNYHALDVYMTNEDGGLRNRIESVTERLRVGKRRQFQEENNFAPVVGKIPSLEPEVCKPKSIPIDTRIALPVDLLEIVDDIKAIWQQAFLKTQDTLKLTLDAAINLALETREQSNCLLWKNERKCRITDSKFG